MVPTQLRILNILLGLLSLFSAVSLAQKSNCYQTLTEKSGIIQTPNYPDPYDANTDCYWEFIRPEEGQCVVFTVEDFNIDTEEQGLCPGDHFALESCGSWLDITPERYYCGDYSDVIDKRGNFELIQHYQINATSLRVSFHSDSSGESRGFLMQYRILDDEGCGEYIGPRIGKLNGEDCVAILDEESGRFISPNYPEPYPSDTACVYGFLKSSPDVCGVFLRAAKFDLEEKDGGTCHDYFGIPGCRLKCGTVKSPTLMFYEFQKGATLLPIQFNSDFSIQGRGFSFSYAQVTDCFNPYQAECPNDQLSLLAEPSECGYAEYHDCSHNDECEGEQICCFDGCLRKCVDPVSNSVRRKREVMALQELMIDVNISEFGMHYNTPLNYKIKAQTNQINTPVPSIPWF